MIQTTQSQSEFLVPTNDSQKNSSKTGSDSEVIDLLKYLVKESDAPAGFVTMNDFMAELEEDPEKAVFLAKARKALANSRTASSVQTVRDLRLERGLSQTKLAQFAKTSQSHIARIEKGTENLAISTCRKLCMVLGVDMNTLNQALVAQAECHKAET